MAAGFQDVLQLCGVFLPSSGTVPFAGVVCFTSEAIAKPSFSSESINTPSFSSEGIAKPSFSNEAIDNC